MSSSRIALEVLKVAEPCKADWNGMKGDDQKRFCEGCQKFVHNLSGMSHDEAEALVCQAAGSLCVRMEMLPTGMVATVGYEGSLRTRPRKGWRFWTGFGVIGAMVAGAVQAFVGQSPMAVSTKVTGKSTAPATAPATQPRPVVMGVMICPPVLPRGGATPGPAVPSIGTP